MLILMGPSTCARCYFMPGTILLFPQRQMLPSFRLASLQLVPGRCSQTEVFRTACAPVLITPGLSSFLPHLLPPHPRALLSYQPTSSGANLL